MIYASVLQQPAVSKDAADADMCVRTGAALGKALRCVDSLEQASDAGAESKRLEEAHRKQMCLQLQVRPSPFFSVQ